MARPQASDFPPYFARYIAKVNAESAAQAIAEYAKPLSDFYAGLPEEKAGYRNPLLRHSHWHNKNLQQPPAHLRNVLNQILL